jgi:hypothetical protein
MKKPIVLSLITLILFSIACSLAQRTFSTASQERENPGTATSQITEPIVYYYFWDKLENIPPDGSIVILPNELILSPALLDDRYGADPAFNLRTALNAVINDSRNQWTSNSLEISDITVNDGHADVVLRGDYFGVGDIVLIAARIQILATIFADPSVQYATVRLNEKNIAKLGISNSQEAKPDEYAYTRYEFENFMADHMFGTP